MSARHRRRCVWPMLAPLARRPLPRAKPSSVTCALGMALAFRSRHTCTRPSAAAVVSTFENVPACSRTLRTDVALGAGSGPRLTARSCVAKHSRPWTQSFGKPDYVDGALDARTHVHSCPLCSTDAKSDDGERRLPRLLAAGWSPCNVRNQASARSHGMCMLNSTPCRIGPLQGHLMIGIRSLQGHTA